MHTECTHICQHCGNAVDEEGQAMLAKKKAEKKMADDLFEEMRRKNWVLRNTSWLMLWLALSYVPLVMYLLFSDYASLEIAAKALLAFIPLLGFLAALKAINDEKVLKTFKQEHPSEYDLLY